MKKEKLSAKVLSYCCSRSPLQCFQLIVFYIVFYTALGAIFYACMLVNIHFLPLNHPKWTLSESRIGTIPGLGYRPLPSIEKTPIPITIENNSTQLWVDKLEAFLEPYYNNKSQNLSDCSGNESATEDKACSVPVPANPPCTLANRFGYSDGSPCILIKINRVYGWWPKPYDEPPTKLLEQLPQLGREFSRDNVYVTCIVQSKKAPFNGTLEYFPGQAIPFRYYPFYNQKGHLPTVPNPDDEKRPHVLFEYGSLKKAKDLLPYADAYDIPAFLSIQNRELRERENVLLIKWTNFLLRII